MDSIFYVEYIYKFTTITNQRENKSFGILAKAFNKYQNTFQLKKKKGIRGNFFESSSSSIS